MKLNSLFWDSNKTAKNAYVMKFDSNVSALCERRGIDFIEIASRFPKIGYDVYLVDGEHPNEEGHTIIFGAVADYFMQKEWL